MKIEISPKEYDTILNWYDGMMYCQLLVIDGKNDWRLPTKEELDYIYNSENDFDFCYWSSTEESDNYAWNQYFSTGYQNPYYKGYINNVRAVRNI